MDLPKFMLLQMLLTFSACNTFSYGQQCSYVTVPVCGDDVTVSPGRLGGSQGEPGPPGKQGPRGISGLRGEKGGMGPKGEVGNLENFQREVKVKLQEIEHLLTPPSCLTSSVYGYQRLRDCKEAFCDNGWTVVQRRFNGSVDFNRNWQEYKEGFGNLTGEFWIGLDEIHRITSTQGCRLRIDLRGFDGTFAFAQYSAFVVEAESDNYRLHVDGYSGTAGNSFNLDHPHNGLPFTTKDRDNDRHPLNCALIGGVPHGGWWHNACFRATLNAGWGRSSGTYANMVWRSWKGLNSVKESTFKIRCD